MPTYEYECEKCGYHFEELQSFKEEPIRECPKCRGKVNRLLGHGAGLIFKGSGFYVTDYARKNSSPVDAPANSSSCNREKPCCGKDAPCDKSPKKDST